jgi:Zn-dependent protease
MRWSWKLGNVLGIGVHMHATFLILLGWVMLSHWMQGHSVGVMLAGVGFILALFSCVLLHEFGHAVSAQKYGIKTRDITLLPIGGVAQLERMPDDPSRNCGWYWLVPPLTSSLLRCCSSYCK